jgi:hypothetical protein
MQIDVLQNIDFCDDFDARRKSAIPHAFVAYSAWALYLKGSDPLEGMQESLFNVHARRGSDPFRNKA